MGCDGRRASQPRAEHLLVTAFSNRILYQSIDEPGFLYLDKRNNMGHHKHNELGFVKK